jgi:hypothetical protein
MWIMPQIALQKVLQVGIREIKDNPEILEDIFNYMHEPDLTDDYGETYVSKIKEWFLTTKVPVLHAWTFNVDRIPCVSIHLANESEDESKAAVGDYFGNDENGEVGTSPFTVQLDIGIHASKSSDQVLWLYYIITYILFKKKLYAESLGLRLQTFTASDWDRRQEYSTENIWTRWIRFRCTTQNFWSGDQGITPTEVELEVEVESANVELEDPDFVIDLE